MSDERQKLLNFLNTGTGQFRYERQVLTSDFSRIENILKGESVPPPLFVEIHPSGNCNLVCRWCRGPSGNKIPDFPASMLSLDVLERLIDELSRLGVKGVLFDGYYGDPLLNPHTIPAMKKAVELEMQVSLGTNGTLLRQSVWQVAAQLTYVRISLDVASSATHNLLKGTRGSPFEAILKNLSGLVAVKRKQKTNVRIGISYLLQPENISEIGSITEKAKSLGVDHVQFKLTLSDPMGRLTMAQIDTAYQQLAEAQKKYSCKDFRITVMQSKQEAVEEMTVPSSPDWDRCYAHYLMAVVGPEGNVYPCCEHTDRSWESFGNIKEQSFEEIWFGKRKHDTMACLCPSQDCTVCSHYNTRINRFLGFVMTEYSNDASFLGLLGSARASLLEEGENYDLWQKGQPSAESGPNQPPKLPKPTNTGQLDRDDRAAESNQDSQVD